MKKFRKLKKIGLYAGALLVPFAISILIQYKPPLSDETSTPVAPKPMSDKQKVLASLLDLQQFNVDAEINVIKPQSDVRGGETRNDLHLDVHAKGDVSDLENLKLQGDVYAEVGTTGLKAGIGYFGDELFFDYGESYFRLETTTLLDFVSMLPAKFNLGLEIPSEISNIDISQFTDVLDNMGEKELQDDGSYYFALDLGNDIVLKIVTDSELRFNGIVTDTISYNDTLFNLNVKLERVDTLEFDDPRSSTESYSKYQDFRPALKLFDGVYNLTQLKKNTINVDLDIDAKNDSNEYRNFIAANLDLTYDLESENHLYALDGNIIVDKKVVDKELDTVSYVPTAKDFSLALYNKQIYTHIGNVALSISQNSITTLIDYVMNQISDETIQSLIDKVTELMSNVDMSEILDKVNNLLGEITLTADELAVALNTSIFSKEETAESAGFDLSNTVISIKFDENTGDLKRISAKDLLINDYKANIVLAFNGYHEFNLDAVEYQSIDHLVEPMIGIYELNKNRSQFRCEFDATVSKENENDITIDGGLQFELDPDRDLEGHENIGYGYGDVNITDRKNVKHKIYADMKSVDELLMSYSTVTNNASKDAETSPMYVKMKVQTMKDIVDLGSEIVQEQDDHFKELTGKLLDTIGSMPLLDIMNDKDYTQALAYTLVNSFEVGEDYLELGISLDILAIESVNAKIRVQFKEEAARNDDELDHLVIDSLHVSDFEFDGLSFEFNASLKEFDDSLAVNRLSKGNKYIDFSDLKVLLRLGINTSKNNYYHFTATAAVKLSLFSITINLPIDIKVWTKDGDVHVSVDFTSIPTDTLASVAIGPADGYYNLSSRRGNLYFHDGFFYVKRFDTCKTAIIFGKTAHLEYSAKYNTEDFLDNILQILLGDIIGLRKTFMNQINDAISEHDDPNYQMKYEKILKDFAYNKEGHYFYFDVDLAEIANNTDLKSFNATIFTDSSDMNLTGVAVDLKVELVDALLFSISISVSANIQLADSALVADDSNRLTALDTAEAYMSSRSSGWTELKRI